MLNAGEKVAILVGQGARGAAARSTEVADLLGAGVAKALLGKDVLPDDLPFVTGSIGLLGTRPSYEMMMGCDTLLTVGSNFPYTQFLPELDQARGGADRHRPGKLIGMRYPYEVNLVGDAAATLRALIPLLQRKDDRSWREKIESDVARWWETMERGQGRAPTRSTRSWCSRAAAAAADNAILAADSGSAANWYARHLRIRGDIRGSLSGTLATMGPGVPYVIGAKFGHPDRPAIAFVGDGAMQMNGIDELITDQRVLASSGATRGWSSRCCTTTTSTRSPGRCGRWRARRSSPSPRPARLPLRGVRREPRPARDQGRQAGRGRRGLGRGARRRPAHRARRSHRPPCPPIPPHATWDEMENAGEAMLKGDEDGWGVKEGVKTKAQEFLPDTTS